MTQTRDEEFTQFVRDSSASLGRTAWLLTGNQDSAADLVQAALVKTYLAWGRVDRATATAYARRALVNDNIDRWRKRHGEVSVPEVFDRPGGSFDRDVENRVHVQRMLAVLPPQQRRVVVLRYYEDMTETQVAEALGISVGTVKSTAHKALNAMRSQLIAEGEVR